MSQAESVRDRWALPCQRFGWYAYGWASHTFETTVITVFMSRYLPAVAQNAVGSNGRLHVLGLPVLPGSLFTYVVSACSVLLVVLMPVVGALADRTGCKRGLLLGLGYLGALSCVAMVFVGRTDWVLGSVLFISAFLSYSCAKVVYNSLLPDLADPDLRDVVSSMGWAVSYIGSGILLAVNFGWSFLIDDSALLTRLSLCSAGVWWAIFSLVPLRFLRHLSPAATQRKPVLGSVVSAGFRELGDTLRNLRKVPLTLLFLVAYLIYYDGISTVTTLSADYGQRNCGWVRRRCSARSSWSSSLGSVGLYCWDTSRTDGGRSVSSRLALWSGSVSCSPPIFCNRVTFCSSMRWRCCCRSCWVARRRCRAHYFPA